MCVTLNFCLQVDVEDKQSGAWHNLTPYDGGLSGWRVLWDRYCPIPSLRSARVGSPGHPRYREMINALSWIAHSQNLRRMCQDYKVDLVLSPPYASSFKLMDYHLVERIVRDAYRCGDELQLNSACFSICSNQVDMDAEYMRPSC